MEPQALTRATFLQTAGAAGALLTVVGSGVGLARAASQGVFTTGEGPAYTAWSEWAGTPGSGMLNLVRAALLAANAHDSQPWLFQIHPDRLDLFADLRRSLGTVDPIHREMYLSLGCALENLLLAAAPHGFRSRAVLFPNPHDRTQIAAVSLRQGTAPTSPLYAAIPKRHTNRGPYDPGRAISPSILQRLQALNTQPAIGVVWYTTVAERQSFSALTIQATEDFIADRQQSTDDFAWWRGDWGDLQRRKDGITLDAAGLSPVIRALGKLLPPQTRESNGHTWLANTRDPQLSTAVAFGMIVSRSAGNTRQWVEAGRFWQRMQLQATTLGLAMQPLNQTVERAEREQTTGLTPRITNGLSSLLPAKGWHAVMPFRIGYPTTDGLKSPRRPAEEVVVSR